MSERPLYATLLFLLVFFAIAFLLYHWFYYEVSYQRHIAREGLATNTQYKYQPGEGVSIEFGVEDVCDEAVSVFDFIKIDNGWTDPSNDMPSAQSKLAISEAYTPIENEYIKQMDLVFAPFFEVKKVQEAFAKQPIVFENEWKKAVKPYSDIYHIVMKYATHPENKEADPFSRYFLLLIEKYKTGDAQLGEIKTFFYRLIKPLFLQSQLNDIYSSNIQRYVNQDGSSNASSLYLVNKSAEWISKSTVSADFPSHNTDGTVYVFKEDSANTEDATFTLDSIKLFHAVGILVQFRHLVNTVNQNKPPLNIIRTTDTTFVSGFQAYLDKKFPTAPPKSKWVFLLNHLPPTD